MVFSGCSAGTCALGVAGAAAVLGGAAFLGVGWMVSSMFHSIPVLPPTDKQLDEEDVERCPLFRHVAALKGKVAWREIGDFPTPIHRCTLSPPSAEGAGVSFYVKREDLSSPDYGGNKVIKQIVAGTTPPFPAAPRHFPVVCTSTLYTPASGYARSVLSRCLLRDVYRWRFSCVRHSPTARGTAYMAKIHPHLGGDLGGGVDALGTPMGAV